MKHFCRLSIFAFFVVISVASTTFATIVVQGRPDMLQHLATEENGGKLTWQVSLQITCAGASSPRIGYGPTRLYYAAPFEKDGTLVEFTPGRSFGYGESDQASVTLLSPEYTETGIRVFPMTEFIRCDDRDTTTGSMMVKDIKGEIRTLMPQISYLNNIRYARPSDDPKIDPNDKRFAEDADQELDREHLPVNKLLVQCFLLNADPRDPEAFQLLMRSPVGDRVLRSYAQKDGKASCEVFSLEKAGRYQIYLRWQIYDIQSYGRLTLSAAP